MEKKLSDYLHLYLGCTVDFSRYNSWNSTRLTPSLLEDFLEGDVRIKPILRPLSSMTANESNEAELAWRKVSEKSDDSTYESDAAQIAFLLSKHFDLFNLIEAGLAIDATTL